MAKVDIKADDVLRATTGDLVSATDKVRVAVHNPFTGKGTTATLDVSDKGRKELEAIVARAEREVEKALRPLADIVEHRNGKRADLAHPGVATQGTPKGTPEPAAEPEAEPDADTAADEPDTTTVTPGGSPVGTYDAPGGGYGY